VPIRFISSLCDKTTEALSADTQRDNAWAPQCDPGLMKTANYGRRGDTMVDRNILSASTAQV
jgi:hypothetical protein